MQQILFGGAKGWHAGDWIASDDRVRGGQSRSSLSIIDETAVFCGNLDIKTLGGAGFASQRTTGDDRHWDLSQTDAIQLLIDPARSDGKQYTFILKDEILPPNSENGREQSTTSWEYDFVADNSTACAEDRRCNVITIPYTQLKPTYRGKENDPGHHLRLSDVRRMSIMMRSHFGQQEGDFALCILSITATNTEARSTSLSSSSCSIAATNLHKDGPKQQQAPGAEDSPNNLWKKIWSSCLRL